MINLQEVPYNYAVCYASPTECKLRQHCLRSLAAQAMEQLPEPPVATRAITRPYVLRSEGGQKCAQFRTDAKRRYACGMVRLFDPVPKGVYPEVRRSVIRAFSSERAFYYARGGDTFISPEQQQHIADIFAKASLPSPEFDAYVDRYDWTL